ncbi:MAG: RDD family protein [Halarcobacter sp.]
MFWDKIVAKWERPSVSSCSNECLCLSNTTYLKFIYQTFFVWYYGATIGKIIAKMKVVDFNNFGRVNIFTAMTRSVFRFFSEMFFYFGFIFAFFR